MNRSLARDILVVVVVVVVVAVAVSNVLVVLIINSLRKYGDNFDR